MRLHRHGVKPTEAEELYDEAGSEDEYGGGYRAYGASCYDSDDYGLFGY